MSCLTRPFSHLNLRHNPFGELDHETFVALAVVDVEEFADFLREPGQAVQFVGRHGRGKTTRLRVLHAKFVEAPYVQVYQADPIPTFAAAPLHFVDSVNHLPAKLRRKLYCCSDRIAVTTHIDLSAEFASAGLQVKTAWIGGADREVLSEIILRRIEHARRGAGPVPVVAAEEINELIAAFGDDLRTIEAVLYERFQAKQ